MIARLAGIALLALLGAGLPLWAEACAGGGEVELACWFDQGLNLQEQAEAVEVPEEQKIVFLQQAAGAYERALAIDPNRGAALNNLAVVYADLSRASEAESRFARAVAQEERLQPFYRRNFGDFLARQGDWARAADQYWKALEETPEDPLAHEGLKTILTQYSPEALPKYLRFLISRGQVLWAEEIALAQLKGQATEEYLSLLIQSLAERAISPEELLPQETAKALQNLQVQPGIGEGAREVLLLSQGDHFNPASYAWWAKRHQSEAGPSPRQAFQHLIRSFGEAQHRADRTPMARAYYQLAVTLAPEEPDFLALLRMADLPSAAQDVETIVRWAEGSEQHLGKEAAIPADLYIYRHDLSLYYASLKDSDRERYRRWGIFQLEQATALANTPLVKKPGEYPPFDARIYNRLIRGYIETGRQEDANRVWLELADAYRDRGMAAEAEILLAAFRPRDRSARERQRDVLDDPPGPLTDFTTEPPEPPE